MAGIYVHIPFCKKICHYCDFYKSGNLKLENNFINAIIEEIDFRKDSLNKKIETIYFGGGTPSTLIFKNLRIIIDKIYKNFEIIDNPEISIELNPDDININYLENLKQVGFNRLSIGIQSFNNSILKFLNRRHNSQIAENSIKLAIESGFSNISIDLIYGIPNQTNQDILNDISVINKYAITHVSAYHLTIEDKTFFGKLYNQNKLKLIDENLSLDYYQTVVNELDSIGFKQYEVSSYARNNMLSKHNTNYWKNVEYLGLGPSAHSYFSKSRFWNVSSLSKYLKLIKSKSFFEKETLNNDDLYNEYILVSLRTVWGIDLDYILSTFGTEYYKYTIRIYDKNKNSIYLRKLDNHIHLNSIGLFVSDLLIQDFFITN